MLPDHLLRDYLGNSVSASAERTPPVMAMVANRAAPATARLVSMVCPSFVASFVDRGGEDHPADATPKNSAHAHGARFARGRGSRALELGGGAAPRRRGGSPPFPVRRRIVGGSAQIATRRQHIAVANDDRAERKVSPRGLGDGDPHEMVATWKGRHLRRARPGLARRGERGPGQART